MNEQIGESLSDFRFDPQSPYSERAQKAAFLARVLQERAQQLQTPQERKQQTELDRMIQTPHDKNTLVQMTDQAFRSANPHRAVDQLVHILDVQGVPRFFNPFDRTLLKGFQSFGSYLPGVAVPLVKGKMHKETANVILPAEDAQLVPFLDARRNAGVRMNVNYLGEALLGEAEAERRLQAYLRALQVPEIEVISVKISTIYSQISALSRRRTIATLSDRMELLYRTAAKATFRRADGQVVPKFVYMDMEEYRDMHITADAFMQSLDRQGLEQVQAGIVLQAYIPDSYEVQQRINEWACRRVAAGGAPITLRIVKGANMEMERVEASVRGWPQAPYKRKVETDANYKRMVDEGIQSHNIQAVRLGIASHNLFDLSYGLISAVETGAVDAIQFEMLEGMANHQRRALFELCQNLLLYAPACRREDFIYAIGYLVRRLDENTGKDNFLRHAFKLHVDNPEWKRLEQGFFQSFDRLPDLSSSPRRIQDRRQDPPGPVRPDTPFANEPDTDFSLIQNCEWADQLIVRWSGVQGDQAADIPIVIGGESIRDDRDRRACRDPSRPGVVVGRYRQATESEIDRAIQCARADDDGWRSLDPADRSEILARVAHEIRTARGDLIGAALADGGKTVLESDPEISEAVDFVEYYARTAADFYALETVVAAPKGVVAVVSPWNFPIAIPCGGIAAALAAGNTVILKPASDTVLVAHQLCECFWRGGVSRKTLQMAPCAGATAGQRLVASPDVDVVILTGGTETALVMLRHRPDMNLLAETGGKNATIVTAMSDRDQAIKNVLHSAFSHSGQKCSATSLLILEEEVFDDAEFKRTLCDAVESLDVGPAWDVKNKIGPLIRPPSGDLENGLKDLDQGQSWAVMPRHLDDNPNLFSPAVKWGVKPESYDHMTEFFGPLLGVMKARNLPEAIQWVNQTGYGLTSGLESLDDREQQIWQESIRAGNLYINRPTTGAIVLRQPFGGMGKSAFGPGIKAGGPNYVAQLMNFEDTAIAAPSSPVSDPPLESLTSGLKQLAADHPEWEADLARVVAAIASYDRQMSGEFGKAHDDLRLIGQDNLRRYRPAGEMRIRVHPDDTLFDLFARVCASKASGCRTTVSCPHHFHPPMLEALDRLTESWGAAIEMVEESDDELAACIEQRQTDRVRFSGRRPVPETIRRSAAETCLFIADTPVLCEGRLELLWYVREQSVCVDYHRYGNLGDRAEEPRSEPA